MQKLELWKQNEPLYADKLNDEVRAINKLIEKEIQNTNVNQPGTSMTFPQFGTTQNELLQMWQYDGEGVVLSGFDFGFINCSGLYARNNETVFNGQRFIPSNTALCKIADYSCLRIGGSLYQEITLTNGTVTNSALKYTNDPLPNDTATTIYRKLSRIEQDCKRYTCANMPVRYKAVAVNETKLQLGADANITTQACIQCQKSHKDKRTKRQTYKLFEDIGTSKDFYGLSNEGGLEFVYSGGCIQNDPKFDKYHGIRAGIELYKVACKYPIRTEQTLNKCDPRPQTQNLETCIFNFPVIIREYKNDGPNWILNCCRQNGAIHLESVKLNCNNWQIGFFQQGAIQIDTYKPILTGGTVGEYICYDVKAKESENNIVTVCKKQTGNKITFEIEGFYCFDAEFFCISDCNGKKKVKLNTNALYSLANEIANDIQVCISTTGIVDVVKTGKIQVRTNGLNLTNDEVQYSAETCVKKI